MDKEWLKKSKENLIRFGEQDFNILLIGTMEELGELAEAYLKYKYENGKFNRIKEELIDLGAICYQMCLKIQNAINHNKDLI